MRGAGDLKSSLHTGAWAGDMKSFGRALAPLKRSGTNSSASFHLLTPKCRRYQRVLREFKSSSKTGSTRWRESDGGILTHIKTETTEISEKRLEEL